MTSALAFVVAVVVGLAIGVGAERLPASPLIQTVVAALAAFFVASVATAGIWLFRAPWGGGIAAVSFGVVEVLITSVGVVVVAVLVHAVLGWIGVSAHRAVIAGVLAALPGAVAATSGTGLGHALK